MGIGTQSKFSGKEFLVLMTCEGLTGQEEDIDLDRQRYELQTKSAEFEPACFLQRLVPLFQSPKSCLLLPRLPSGTSKSLSRMGVERSFARGEHAGVLQRRLLRNHPHIPRGVSGDDSRPRGVPKGFP